MPDISGNIPRHVFYGSVMSEFFTIARCTLHYSNFLPPAISLFKRMIGQGGSKSLILKQMSKTINRHLLPFTKYPISAHDIMDDIFFFSAPWYSHLK